MTALRISDAASLALHAMVLVANSPTQRHSAKEMAARLCVSEAHLAKVLQRLAHVGLVRSVRGPHGGFTLARPCHEVSLLDVYEAIDGPLTDAKCLLHQPACRGLCLLGELLGEVNAVVRKHLSQMTLCGLARGFEPTRAERKRKTAAA